MRDSRGRGSRDALEAARGDSAYWWIKAYRKAMEVAAIVLHRAPAAGAQQAKQALLAKASAIASELKFEDLPQLEQALAHERELQDNTFAWLRNIAAMGDNACGEI